MLKLTKMKKILRDNYCVVAVGCGCNERDCADSCDGGVVDEVVGELTCSCYCCCRCYSCCYEET